MKKIIYVCLLVLLVVSFGCEKEDLQSEQENAILSQENSEKVTNSLENIKGTNTNFNVQNQSIGSSDDDEVYILYINMDLIEEEYSNNSSNSSYTGPFNLFYRNLMSNYFTIYNINVSTNFTCGNIERWYVNLEELNQYLLSIGEDTVTNETNDPGNGGSTGGANTNGTKGENDKDKKPDIDHDREPDSTPLLHNYSNCF